MRRWILAARPATLTAAFVPVAVGTACAHAAGGLAWGPALAALFGAFWIQIGTNFANDVFDAEKGADTEAHRTSGFGLARDLLRGRGNDLPPELERRLFGMKGSLLDLRRAIEMAR